MYMDTFSTGSAIKSGWEVFKKRPGFLIGTIFLIWIASWLGSFMGGIVQAAIASNNALAAIITGLVFMIVVQVLVNIGYISFFLRAYDNVETARMSDAWRPQYFLNFLITTVLVYIIIAIGFLLLIIPGIIASVALMFAPYLVIDKGLSPIAAMKESMRITKGSRLRLFALVMASMLVMLLGVLALVVGILAAIPVVMLAMVAAYRALSAMTPETPKKPLSFGEIVLVCLVGLLIPLGILSSIVLASLNVAREKGRAASTSAQMSMLQLSLELYYDAHGTYPQSLEAALQPTQDATFKPTTSDFTYTLADDDKAYTLCAKNPMPTGKEQCATSSATVSTSTPQ